MYSMLRYRPFRARSLTEMDLRESLATVGLDSFEGKLVDEGVECVAGIFNYFCVNDLKAIGFKTVQAEKALALGKSSAEKNAQNGAGSCASPVVPSLSTAAQVDSTLDSAPADDGEVQNWQFVPNASGGQDDGGSDDGVIESSIACSGGRRSAKQRADRVRVSGGGGALYRCATDDLEVAGDGSCCSVFLQTLDGRLLPALRKSDERNRIGARQRKYQYSRLQLN